MTDHTDLREQIDDLLVEFAPVSSTRIIADEIVHRLAAPEIDRLRVERAALWDLLRKQTRQVRTWRRRASTAIADAVEQTARDMQRCGQLRHDLAEARAEIARLRAERAALWTMLKRQTRRVQRWRRWTMDANTEITRLRDLGQQLCAAIGVPDAVEPIGWARDLRAELERLRAAGTEVRRHWLSQWPSSRHAVRDVSPSLHDAIDTLAARSQAAADNTCTRPLVDRVQVFYDDDEVSEVIEAPRAQAEWTPTPGERVRVRGHRDRTGTVAHLDTPGRVRVAWDTHPDTPMSVPADRIEPAEETRVRSWHVGDHEPIEEGLRLMGRDSRYASDEWKPDEYWYRLSSGVWSGPWGYKLGWDALLEHQAPLVEYRKPTEETR